MKNFFAATNLTDGTVTGCLTRTLPTVCSSDPSATDALVHAKPILIQGAWLAGGDPAEFEPFAPAMEALLAYWDRPPRRDARTGLRVWHDQLESGADNLVLSRCPNRRSACWSDAQAYTLASPDVMVLLAREHAAAALFRDAWAAAAPAAQGGEAAAAVHAAGAAAHRAAADDLEAILNARLWRDDLGRASVDDMLCYAMLCYARR